MTLCSSSSTPDLPPTHALPAQSCSAPRRISSGPHDPGSQPIGLLLGPSRGGDWRVRTGLLLCSHSSCRCPFSTAAAIPFSPCSSRSGCQQLPGLGITTPRWLPVLPMLCKDPVKTNGHLDPSVCTSVPGRGPGLPYPLLVGIHSTLLEEWKVRSTLPRRTFLYSTHLCQTLTTPRHHAGSWKAQ